MPENVEPQARPRPDDGLEIDLHAYWRVIVRRRWVVLGVFAAVVLGALVFTLRQTKLYAATTTLIIDVSAPKVLNSKDVQDVMEPGAAGYWSAKEYYATQYKVITSRAVAQRVVDKLQLARDLRFLGLDDRHDEKAVAAALARIDPVEVLQKRLSVVPVKDSQVVQVEVEDRDPRWAATLANAVAEAYITENLSVRSATTQSASDWLEQQLGDLEAKLAKSADALFKFKQAHDIVATSWEDRQSMVTQRLAAINDALTRARVQKAQFAARNEELRNAVEEMGKDPAAESSVLVNQNPAIPELKVHYLQAQVECADMAIRYLAGHPKAEACDARVAAARAALDREVKGTLAAARREYDEAAAAERNLKRLLAQTKAEAFGVNQYEKEYLELKRTNDNNQRLYEMVLARLKDTGVTGMLQMSNVRILDRAGPSDRPVSPRPARNLLVAVLFGVAGGVALALLLEFLDTSVTSREQVELELGLPFLGIFPAIEGGKTVAERDLFVHQNGQSPAAECLRSIRTNLLFMSPDKPLRTILITSSGPAEGKTTTAVSLAQIMADGGNRVLLVDADMRRPRIHEIFGVTREAGLSSLILGQGTIEAAVHETSIRNLAVLTSGPVPPNPAELLHTKDFGLLLAKVAAQYDRIIIDSPPAGAVSDPVIMSTQVDGTVMILNAGSTTRDAAKRAVRVLRDVNARFFGAVLNEVDTAGQRYGNYYHSYQNESTARPGVTSGRRIADARIVSGLSAHGPEK